MSSNFKSYCRHYVSVGCIHLWRSWLLRLGPFFKNNWKRNFLGHQSIAAFIRELKQSSVVPYGYFRASHDWKLKARPWCIVLCEIWAIAYLEIPSRTILKTWTIKFRRRTFSYLLLLVKRNRWLISWPDTTIYWLFVLVCFQRRVLLIYRLQRCVNFLWVHIGYAILYLIMLLF